jgi:hypothetical protein
MPSLLDLPIEVRLRIYDVLLDSYPYFTADEVALTNPNQPTAEAREMFKSLLLVCKTMHHEATPAFYRSCTFYANRPYDFANTFLRRLTIEEVTMDKVVSIRHLELKLEACRPLNEWSHECTYTKGERKYWMDLVRVFDVYRELSRLDSLMLTLTRTRSDVAFYVNPNFGPNISIRNVWNTEREAQRMLEVAQILHRKRLPNLVLSRDVQDIFAQDMNPASGTYQGWKPQRIFTVRLLREWRK